MLKRLLLLLLLPLTLRAQPQTYTPAQVERLAKLSELYGHIKFFHPYLGYQRLNWDSAYAQNAPLIAQARTDAETADALRRLLAVLGDPATTVRLAGPKAAAQPTTAADSMQVQWATGNTLTLKANSYAGAEQFAVVGRQLSQLLDLLPKADAVLLDLRSPRPLSNEQASTLVYAVQYTRLGRRLANQPGATPSMRLRGHSGFAAEGGSAGSGGYYSYYYTKSGEPVLPYATNRLRPLTILLNQHSVLPPTLYALVGQPQVRCFSTGPVSDVPLAETVKFPFGDHLTVEFRTGEIVNPDGSLGLRNIEPVPTSVHPEATEAYVLAQAARPRPAAPAGLPTPVPTLLAPPAYPAASYPELGYRLLAGAKIWAIIHYFHAYRDLIPSGWEAALRSALAELAAASDAQAYALAVAHYYRHIQDGHGDIRSQVLSEYIGSGGVALDVRFIDGQAVIAKIYNDSLQAKGLRMGDVITAVNSEPTAERLARLLAIRPASNEWTRLSYQQNRLVRAPLGKPMQLALRGADGHPKTVIVYAQPGGNLEPAPDTSPAFRILPGNIGYVDLGRLESEDTNKMFAALMGTKAIIFDMRGYPHGTAWTIAPRLTERKQPGAANFFRYTPTMPSVSGNDGIVTEKMFFTQAIPANAGKPVYKGKTVMLIDERTQSQAEHTGLFFEAANGTEFIGSPTAGANGDVTSFSIPGAITLSFSGHDVRHADGRQLQQVGLQPRILVRPTLKGIRAGQDEVLARAVRYLNTGR
ncbi:MAG: S41 family peptidase [Janthinobacterium lividum]